VQQRPAAVGLRWAPHGLAAGPMQTGSGPRARPGRSGRIIFLFSEILFSAKTNPEKCLKALKILRKSQKF
jgi:hypothetical protein